MPASTPSLDRNTAQDECSNSRHPRRICYPIIIWAVSVFPECWRWCLPLYDWSMKKTIFMDQSVNGNMIWYPGTNWYLHRIFPKKKRRILTVMILSCKSFDARVLLNRRRFGVTVVGAWRTKSFLWVFVMQDGYNSSNINNKFTCCLHDDATFSFLKSNLMGYQI